MAFLSNFLGREMIKVLVLVFILSGCATVQATFDRVCGTVATADNYTAAALTAAQTYHIPIEYRDKYLFPIAQTVVEAHDMCFAAPDSR